MLYYFLEPYFSDSSFFNLFRYISFRAVGAFFTALILCFVFGHEIIRFLKKRQLDGQPIRVDGPESHLLSKKGTPTMGGIIILFPLLISMFIWSDITNPFLYLTSFVILFFAGIGAIDDFHKLRKKSSDGISGKKKLLLQFIGAFIAIVFLNYIQTDASLKNILYFPFFKDLMLDLGIFYIIFGMVVIVGTSNAVNLTDGLDGLAIVPIMMSIIAFSLIAYLSGNVLFSDYLQLPFIAGAGEMAIIGAAVIGSSIGFLWYNAPPAKVFMGDTGSLSMGALIALFALITKNELNLLIIGGLFVVEAVSVIIQVYYYKLTKKRFFRMAPIHHHYEKKGWPEAKVVIRFWIISVILCIIGLLTLKIR